jgi:hypothetical protein
MRMACTQQKSTASTGAKFWDEWLDRVKADKMLHDLYKDLKRFGLGYIQKSNEEIFKPHNNVMRPVVNVIEDELD